MFKKQPSLIVVLALIFCATFFLPGAAALNFTGSQGNKATFETLEETRVSSPLPWGSRWQ